MMTFHPLQPEDRDWIETALSHASQRGCEYHFATLCAWRHAYDVTVSQAAGMFTEHIGGEHPAYLFPVGEGDLSEALGELKAHCTLLGTRFLLRGVTPENIRTLEDLFPGRFEFTPHRDGFDYLYTVEQLAGLEGRRYSAKRNHINRFCAQNPDWHFEPLTPDNLPHCLAMADEWYSRSNANRPEDAESMAVERQALEKCLKNFDYLRLEGGLLCAGGQLAAFTLGGRLSPNSDTFDVQFEKAFLAFEGAYPMINREFARHLASAHPDLRYLNREEDMGLEGLRKSKESYYPCAMVEKHTAAER